MTTPTITRPCADCDGEGYVVLEVGNVDVVIDCPCRCSCGQPKVTELFCAECAAEVEYDTRARRREQ